MDQPPRLPLWFLFANWAMVLLALATGFYLGNRRIADLPEPQGSAIQLVWNEILKSHVEEQDGSLLLDRAIGAMVDELDPYSRYVPPGEAAAYDEANTGHYEGIGVVMVQHGEDLVIHYPMTGGPAERAGLRPGDRVVAVDGADLRTTPLDERHAAAARMVRGPAGTTVRLRIAREGGEQEFTVARSGVQQTSVKWAHVADADQRVGYAHLAHFQQGSADDLARAIETLQAGGPLRGFVLDLRGNGGGSLEECVAITNLFLQSGTIVSQRRRGSEVVETRTSDPQKCRFPALPLAVLLDGGSASASEVLAGALHDHGRAVLVGTPTYGKGYVNTNYKWKEFRLKLTTAHFFTPSGRNIERPNRRLVTEGRATAEERAAFDAGGIHPDVETRVTKAEATAVAAMLEARETPPQHLAAFTAVAAKHGIRVPGPPTAETDSQLAKALAALRERITAPSNGSPNGTPPKER